MVLHTPEQAGALQITYEDRVWDANIQPAGFYGTVNDQRVLSIVVKDENATYPVTIDPVNRKPDWNTSMDGLTTSCHATAVKDGSVWLCGYRAGVM